MLKKVLAPLKSTVKTDHAAEVARLDFEITMLESRAARIARQSWIFIAAGVAAGIAVTLGAYWLANLYVIWGLPFAAIGIAGAVFSQTRRTRLLADSQRLRKQRKESKAMLERNRA